MDATGAPEPTSTQATPVLSRQSPGSAADAAAATTAATAPELATSACSGPVPTEPDAQSVDRMLRLLPPGALSLLELLLLRPGALAVTSAATAANVIGTTTSVATDADAGDGPRRRLSHRKALTGSTSAGTVEDFEVPASYDFKVVKRWRDQYGCLWQIGQLSVVALTVVNGWRLVIELPKWFQLYGHFYATLRSQDGNSFVFENLDFNARLGPDAPLCISFSGCSSTQEDDIAPLRVVFTHHRCDDDGDDNDNEIEAAGVEKRSDRGSLLAYFSDRDRRVEPGAPESAPPPCAAGEDTDLRVRLRMELIRLLHYDGHLDHVASAEAVARAMEALPSQAIQHLPAAVALLRREGEGNPHSQPAILLLLLRLLQRCEDALGLAISRVPPTVAAAATNGQPQDCEERGDTKRARLS